MTWTEQVRNQNALTEIAWEAAAQGLGMAISTVASEKTVISLRVVSLVFRGHDLLKMANINSQPEATLSL